MKFLPLPVSPKIAARLLKSVSFGNCWSWKGAATPFGHGRLKFNRTLNSLPKTKRSEFEAEQIREGRILPVGKMREVRKPNPFTSEVS